MACRLRVDSDNKAESNFYVKVGFEKVTGDGNTSTLIYSS